MQGLMIFTDGFEDVEGIATTDILHRANINLEKVAFSNLEVTTSNGNIIKFNKKLSEVNYENYDFLIIPGGPAVFKILDNSELISKIITNFVSKNKLVCAICAAPLLIGKLGYFKNNEYTCFPGCEAKIIIGTKSNEPVVTSGNFITARSMYYSNDFALAIVAKLLGKDVALIIEKQVKGIKDGD